MQVEPAGLAVEGQALFVQVFVGQLIKFCSRLRHGSPRYSGANRRRAAPDVGEFFHGFVPHQDFLILGQRADAHRQFLQGLAVVAAQGVEFRGQAGEA